MIDWDTPWPRWICYPLMALSAGALWYYLWWLLLPVGVVFLLWCVLMSYIGAKAAEDSDPQQ